MSLEEIHTMFAVCVVTKILQRAPILQFDLERLIREKWVNQLRLDFACMLKKDWGGTSIRQA
jgi:hypothetical protein